MSVALLDLDGDRAQKEATSLASAHKVDAIGLAVDVAHAEGVQAAADAVAARFGRADLVVSNVGVQLFGSLDRLTDDEWRWVLDVNVIGAARMARTFLPLLKAAPHGRLAFTASSSVLDPASRMAAYQASKFALWGLAETLRLELRNDGITVSVVFPAGMASRHLETSEAAQPHHVRRPIGEQEDFEAMYASNPGLRASVAVPDEAAGNVIDALLAGDRYIVTHGDLVDAVTSRCAELREAASNACARDSR